jgi:hypothetical protein
LDGLLDTLVEAEKRNGGVKTVVDIVTWRGMMTRVCCFFLFSFFSLFFFSFFLEFHELFDYLGNGGEEAC